MQCKTLLTVCSTDAFVGVQLRGLFAVGFDQVLVAQVTSQAHLIYATEIVRIIMDVFREGRTKKRGMVIPLLLDGCLGGWAHR